MADKKSSYQKSKTVNQRWNASKHPNIENLRQANARLREFAIKDVESPSFTMTQEFLENRPHKETKLQRGNRTIWLNEYPDYSKLSPKEKRDTMKSINKFLDSETGTVNKYNKVLRKRYESFTHNNDINRRRFTFNQYKSLFENYNQLFEVSYEDSDKVVIAVVAHTFMYGKNATEEWLKSLSDKVNDDKNKQKIEDLVDSVYNMRYEKADEIDWKY